MSSYIHKFNAFRDTILVVSVTSVKVANTEWNVNIKLLRCNVGLSHFNSHSPEGRVCVQICRKWDTELNFSAVTQRHLFLFPDFKCNIFQQYFSSSSSSSSRHLFRIEIAVKECFMVCYIVLLKLFVLPSAENTFLGCRKLASPGVILVNRSEGRSGMKLWALNALRQSESSQLHLRVDVTRKCPGRVVRLVSTVRLRILDGNPTKPLAVTYSLKWLRDLE
jgi:hypothetical protein